MTSKAVLRGLLFSFPVVVAGVLALRVVIPFSGEQGGVPELERVSVDNAASMVRLFAERGIVWPPREGVPPITVTAFPPDLDALEVSAKKRLFFSGLLPAILVENGKIRRQRARLESLFAQGTLDAGSEGYLEVLQIGAHYRVDGDPNDSGFRQRLLRRVDVIPAGLALAQAANESAWGTSRFAREGNNLFGHWTYDPAQGMLPRDRVDGAKHFVRIFPDIQSSVRAYLHNINSGRAYRALREARANMRAAGEPLDGALLAAGLVQYSERGEAYVEDIRALIRSNGLDRFSGVRLVFQ